MEKRLYRDESRKMVGGVCAGLSDYLNLDVSILRAIFLLALILKGGGGLIYIVLWIVLPKRDFYLHGTPQPPFGANTPPYNQPYVDYTVPPASPFGTRTDFNVPPMAPLPKKGNSNFGLIAGLILTLFGVFILIDQLEIIPDWDFEHLWPLILIIVGVVLVSTGFGKKEEAPQFPPVDKQPAPEVKKDLKDNSTNTNTPTE